MIFYLFEPLFSTQIQMVVVVVDPFLFRFVINEHLSLDPWVCYCNSEILKERVEKKEKNDRKKV